MDSREGRKEPRTHFHGLFSKSRVLAAARECARAYVHTRAHTHTLDISFKRFNKNNVLAGTCAYCHHPGAAVTPRHELLAGIGSVPHDGDPR